jgi:hypothetical protein
MLALVTILFGFAFGGAFGAFEDPLRRGLTERAEAVQETVYGGDAAKMKSVVDKSWAYYKRAHLHGGAIGIVALGGILLVAALRRPNRRTRQGVSMALGIGGLGYSMFWFLAARAAQGSAARTRRRSRSRGWPCHRRDSCSWRPRRHRPHGPRSVRDGDAIEVISRARRDVPVILGLRAVRSLHRPCS